jgi:hypothetical protein
LTTKTKFQSILSKDDWYAYLILLYFGDGNPLSSCINRAYRDFNRTLHGLGQHKNNELIFEKATAYLKYRLRILKNNANGINQVKFDRWHRNTCTGLINVYKELNYSHFTFGQAQKWINMTLKYIFTMGPKKISGFKKVYPFCHAPIDNIILDTLLEYNAPKISCKWSRLKNYEEYFTIQLWLRNSFETVPLDTEFKMWKGENLKVLK